MTRARLPDRGAETAQHRARLREQPVLGDARLRCPPRPDRRGVHARRQGRVRHGPLLNDVCVALSLLLQHGAEPRPLAASMGRLGDGTSPASIVGDDCADPIAREARRRGHELDAEGVRRCARRARTGQAQAAGATRASWSWREDDDRLTWPEREFIRRLGEKLYGKREEPRHG